MADVKEERPTSSSTRASQDANANNEVANLASLATLNFLHEQLMQLRASVNQFLYPLSKPDTHNSAISLADSFAENAQVSNDFLKTFSLNYRRHKGVFDFVNEKYESNSKGLLPFRTPTADELAYTGMVATPALRQDSTIRMTTNLPHTIEYYEDGLNDISQINRDWEQFKESQTNITCERLSETEFKVTLPKPVQFLSINITLVPLRSKPTSYTLAISSPNPPTTDLHTNILKELSQHKNPKSFNDFLVHPTTTPLS